MSFLPNLKSSYNNPYARDGTMDKMNEDKDDSSFGQGKEQEEELDQTTQKVKKFKRLLENPSNGKAKALLPVFEVVTKSQHAVHFYPSIKKSPFLI